MLALRPYQLEAADAVVAGLVQGPRRQLIVLPTGTGKTLIMAELARRLRRRALVLVHRRELVDQAVSKFAMLVPGIEVGVVQGPRNEIDARHVTVASVDTLQDPRRLDQLTPDYGAVFADEAHHAVSSKWLRLLRWAGCFARDGAVLVGFTATPRRADGVALGHVFQRIAYQRSLLWAIAQGYLCDLRGVAVRTRVSLDPVPLQDGELSETALARVVNVANRNALVVDAYRQHASGRRALCFTVDVAHAEALAGAFRASGIAAAAVSGGMGAGRRSQVLTELAAGRLAVITNCAVLTEGYDEPSVSAVLMARPLVSQALYTQCVGRGTRLFPGKRDCLVIDFADNARRLQLQCLPTLAGGELKLAPRAGEGLRAALARQAALLGPDALVQGLGLQAEAVDLFRRSRFNWLPAGPALVLRLGPGDCLRLVPDPGRAGHFHVVHAGPDGSRRLSDESLDVGYAQGLAEDWARGHLGPFARRDAGWRQRQATDKQRAELHRHGIAPGPGLSRGEASDLIERIFAARR